MDIDTDVSDEQQLLTSIYEETQTVLARMEQVKQRYAAARATIDGLVAATRGAASELGDSMKNADTTIGALLDDVAAQVAELAGAKERLATAFGTAASGFGEAADAFAQSAGQSRTAIGESLEHLDDLLARVADDDVLHVGGAMEEFGMRYAAVATRLQEAGTHAQAACDAGIAEMREAFGECQQRVAVDLGPEVERLATAGEAALQDRLVGPVGARAEASEAHLQGVGEQQAAASLEAIRTAATGVLHETIDPALSEFAALVGEALKGVAAEFERSGEANSVGRQGMNAIVPLIEELIGPLSTSVSNAASVQAAVGAEQAQ